jgi:hypothetical protein
MRKDCIYGMREDPFRSSTPSQGRGELFDLLNDPDKHIDLFASQTGLSQALRKRLGEWIEYDQRHPIGE